MRTYVASLYAYTLSSKIAFQAARYLLTNGAAHASSRGVIWSRLIFSSPLSSPCKNTIMSSHLVFQEGIMGRNLILFRSLIISAKSGQNPTCNKILYFHIKYLNRHILSFRYRTHDIQKPKFIYTFRTTTFMKGSKSNKIVFKMKILMQDG